MAFDIATAGVAIGQQALGSIIDRQNNIRQFNQSKELMGIQHGNQMVLNKQAAELALQQWKDTNYNAQREEMEKAGLNVGLMYGMGGGGGTTASTGSGGSASMGSAPQAPAMDINVLGQMAQLDLLKAQTEKTKAETTKLSGVDTENVSANTALTEMNTANAKIQNTIGNQTLDEAILGVKANYDKAQSEARNALTGANINENTRKEQEEQIKNEAIQSAIEIGAKKMGIQLNGAQIKNMQDQIKINKFNAEKIGLDQVAGQQLNKLINLIYDKMGIKHPATN